MAYQLKYWNSNGKYQALYDAMQETLVPMEGDAKTKAGKIIRRCSNVYYERFNNGGSFHGGQRRDQARGLMQKVPNLVPPAKHDEPAWDRMVDTCVEAAKEALKSDPASMKLVTDYLAKNAGA